MNFTQVESKRLELSTNCCWVVKVRIGLPIVGEHHIAAKPASCIICRLPVDLCADLTRNVCLIIKFNTINVVLLQRLIGANPELVIPDLSNEIFGCHFETTSAVITFTINNFRIEDGARVCSMLSLFLCFCQAFCTWIYPNLSPEARVVIAFQITIANQWLPCAVG